MSFAADGHEQRGPALPLALALLELGAGSKTHAERASIVILQGFLVSCVARWETVCGVSK